MWDQNQLIRMNNQAALDWLMEGHKVRSVQETRPPDGWPLTILQEKLGIGPSSLAELMRSFSDLKGASAFENLVQRFLPTYEQDIMRLPRKQRVYAFCSFFNKTYFPLPSIAYDSSMYDFSIHLPVELMGLGYTSYHDLSMRSGYILLLSLLVYPFEGSFLDEEDDSIPYDLNDLPPEKYKPPKAHIKWLSDLVKSLRIGGEWIAPAGMRIVKLADREIEISHALDKPDVKSMVQCTRIIAEKLGIKVNFSTSGRSSEEKMNGARVPLITMVGDLVGQDLARKIPREGWGPPQLHQLTDNTKYDGLGHFADWACGDTDTEILDCSYENCQWIEGDDRPYFLWCEYNVDLLRKQYPTVYKVTRKMDTLVEWLEFDLISRFRELLDFLLEKSGGIVEPYQSDKYERYCCLEPVTMEDVEDILENEEVLIE